jgi:hypothetical protein
MPLDLAEVSGFVILDHLGCARDLMAKARAADTRG